MPPFAFFDKNNTEKPLGGGMAMTLWKSVCDNQTAPAVAEAFWFVITIKTIVFWGYNACLGHCVVPDYLGTAAVAPAFKARVVGKGAVPVFYYIGFLSADNIDGLRCSPAVKYSRFT